MKAFTISNENLSYPKDLLISKIIVQPIFPLTVQQKFRRLHTKVKKTEDNWYSTLRHTWNDLIYSGRDKVIYAMENPVSAPTLSDMKKVLTPKE